MCLSVVSVVCCQVEVSATRLSLVQRSPTDCGVSLCVSRNLVNDEPWPTADCRAENKLFYTRLFIRDIILQTFGDIVL